MAGDRDYILTGAATGAKSAWFRDHARGIVWLTIAGIVFVTAFVSLARSNSATYEGVDCSAVQSTYNGASPNDDRLPPFEDAQSHCEEMVQKLERRAGNLFLSSALPAWLGWLAVRRRDARQHYVVAMGLLVALWMLGSAMSQEVERTGPTGPTGTVDTYPCGSVLWSDSIPDDNTDRCTPLRDRRLAWVGIVSVATMLAAVGVGARRSEHGP